MNINLVYEGKSHNFDIQKGATIDYLKELSSKIFQSNKDFLDIIYNNEILQNCDSDTLIKDLIPDGETNAVLTVQKNKNFKCLKSIKQIIPLTSETPDLTNNKDKNENIDKKKENRKDTNTNNNTNNKNIFNKDNKNICTKINNNTSKNSTNINYKDKKFNHFINLNLNKKEYDAKGFIVNYYSKYNELLSLMKNFNEKMNNIHILLIKKFKNSKNANSSNNINVHSSFNSYFFELSLYEKKLIDFEDMQIRYYKNLLEILTKNSNYPENLKLGEFYNTLILYDTKKINNKISRNRNFANSSLELLSGKSESINFPIKLKKVNSDSFLTKKEYISTYSKLPIIKKNSPITIKSKRLDESQTITNRYSKKISLSTNNELLNNSNLKKKTIEDTNKNNQINNANTKDDIKSNKSILSSDKELSIKTKNINALENSNKALIKAENYNRHSTIINENYLDKISNEDIISVGSRNNMAVSPKRRTLLTKKKSVLSDDNRILNEELNNLKKKTDRIVDFQYELNNSKIKKETMKLIDVSGMTINDSNFNRDKQSYSKTRKKKSMNKFDYII